MIIVDTSVWITSFRHPNSLEARELRSLLRERSVLMLGIVLGEMLQGARRERERTELQDSLDGPTYLEVSNDVWKQAGLLSSQLRQQGSGIPLADALIATLALQGDHQLYTLDEHLRRVPALKLYRPHR